MNIPHWIRTDSDLTQFICEQFGKCDTESENAVIDKMIADGWKQGWGPDGNEYFPPAGGA